VTVDELLAEFRRKLADAERNAAAELEGAYARIVDRLTVQQQQLVTQVAALRAQGQALTAEQIRQLDGFQRLLADVRGELDDYAALIQESVRRNVTEAVDVGLAQARKALLAQVPEAMRPQIEAVFSRISVEAITAMVTSLQEGSPLWQTLARFGADGAAGIGDTLLETLLRGDGPREAARRMLKAWGIPLTDALRISRTELLRAHRWATLEGFRNNADVVTGWIWCAALDALTCMACIALDGTRFPLEETLDDHPNGRCTMLPVTKSWAEMGFTGMSDLEMPTEGHGEEWFRSLDAAAQREMMGDSKWAAWQAGEFQFRDLARASYDADWGRMFSEASLKQLLG